MNQNREWFVYALLSAFFAAMTGVLGKIGVSQINSNMATLIRIAVIAVVLSPMLLLRGEWVPLDKVSGKTWIFLTLSGLATGASWLAYYRALQLGSVSLVAPVDKLSVTLAILAGVLILGEKLTALQWTGAGLITAGVVLIAWPAQT